MIFYLVTGDQRRIVERFLESRGRELARCLTAVAYEDILRARSIPRGHYLFADLERLAPRDAERAGRLWTLITDAGCRAFNHPTRALRRYELLRRLHDLGLNRSDVYRVTEARSPRRYPVFLRRENDHRGSRTELLSDADALAAALAALDRCGASREDVIISEFCETADSEGIYWKYAAFLLNGQVLPRHVFYSKHWVVKGTNLLDHARVRLEQRYLDENPHEAKLREVFALARIEYGRIDYSLRGDGIEVWEINTHPTLPHAVSPGGPAREPINAEFTRRLLRALAQLESAAVAPGPAIATGVPRRLLPWPLDRQRRRRRREPAPNWTGDRWTS